MYICAWKACACDCNVTNERETNDGIIIIIIIKRRKRKKWLPRVNDD